MADKVHVVLGGMKTPVVLNGTGPRPTKRDLSAFETRLGFDLPADYREFLSKYNGGSPVIGDVVGRDDDEAVPYQHGDSVNSFLKVPVAGKPIKKYSALPLPSISSLKLPSDVLVIAHDAGGNAFVLSLGAPRGEVRFVDHESHAAWKTHRVMATTFLDLLQRFRTVDDQTHLEDQKRAAERQAILVGPMPEGVASQCDTLQASHPNIRSAVRSACLAIFDQKGSLDVHDDARSRDLLDLVLWMALSTTHPDGVSLTAFQNELLDDVWGAPSNGAMGFSGYAPGFIEDWWTVRTTEGAIVAIGHQGRLTPAAQAAISSRVDIVEPPDTLDRHVIPAALAMSGRGEPKLLE